MLQPATDGLKAPLNTFNHAARNLVLVNGVPLGNGASLYSYAPYTLVNGPLLLTLPPYDGGYWLTPFYDAYGQTYYVTGSRQGDNGGGKWLLVPHDWSGEVPEDVRIVRSPTLEGIILGRTSFNGTGAANWTLTWQLERWTAPGPNDVALPPFGLGFGYPSTDRGALRAVNPNDPLAFWRVAGELFKRNGGPYIPQPLLSQLSKLGLWRDYGFIAYGLDPDVTDALALAPLLATRILVAKYTFLGSPETNYWNLPVYNGGWGNDYVLGAAIMKGFWVSNLLEDAAYYYLYVDSDGQPLNGNNTYDLVFPAAPPATSGAFWSLQALGQDTWTLIFGPNPINTALSSATNLYVREDGTIPVRVQAERPPVNTTAEQRGWNWVWSYPGHFHLILRIYAGDASVLSNTYVPPAVLRRTAEGGGAHSGAAPSPSSLPSPLASPLPSPAQ